MRQARPNPTPTRTPDDPERAASVRTVAEGMRGMRGPLLPILHEVVKTHGYIHDDDLPVIADVLNLSQADVHGVVSFYHDLRRTPAAAHHVALCRGEACQARGAEPLHAEMTQRWAANPVVEVSEVFCLGLCALGPSGLVDGQVHARLSVDRLEAAAQGWSQ